MLWSQSLECYWGVQSERQVRRGRAGLERSLGRLGDDARRYMLSYKDLQTHRLADPPHRHLATRWLDPPPVGPKGRPILYRPHALAKLAKLRS